jgi:hypothetical protein
VERRQLEQAAVTYSHLRGLLLLPLGALCVLAALANWDVVPEWSFPAGVAVAAGVCLLIGRHYREHYGRLSVSDRQRRRDIAAVVVALVVVIGASAALQSLPVNALAVAFALAMLAAFAISPGLRTHHVVVWGALLIVGALPVWDGDDSSNVGLVLAGVAVAITGVFDHRAFLGTFGRAADVGT